ncbi:MAG: hypothetical protein LBL96_01100 [Clostridiales bacterium]|jgi:hypothetical protein|nr:hypothetical protein [Clostridiales bacterium]
MKKVLKVTIIAVPYVLLVLYGLFSLGTYLFEKSHEETVETLLVNRGNRFDIHYDNSWLSQGEHSLWVNGKYVALVGMVTKPADEFIKEYIIGFSPDGYEPYTSIMSYLIKDNYIIYKTSDMEGFKVLGVQRLNEITLNSKHLLEDMDSVIKHEYPIHATSVGNSNAVSPEPNNHYGKYEGLGYRIEALTNGEETEWQFYVTDEGAGGYIKAGKIFSFRWRDFAKSEVLHDKLKLKNVIC